MIKLCKKQKIDVILTKSISRFARSTVDCLNYIRVLKELGIAVIFEKENINTLETDSEILITMMGAFAQAESESISANVRWGKRQAMREGKAIIFIRDWSVVFQMCLRHGRDLFGHEKRSNDCFRAAGGAETARASLSVVGSWGGGMAGAKLGAAAGAGIGTAILPGLGTAVGGIVGGLVLGVAGSMGASALAEYVVDITDIWE